MAKELEVPLLLICYQRVETVIEILETALHSGISCVYISIDAPRTQDKFSIENFNKLKEVVDSYRNKFSIINHRYLESNVGCGLHVLTSIDWAFKSTQELIILEDDCIPVPDFFDFVKDGLEVMRRHSDISLVCGAQQVPSDMQVNSFYKSKYSLTWGWATSRNRWEEFKYAMVGGALNTSIDILDFNSERVYWREGARRALNGFVDVWDTPLVCYLQSTDKFALLPRENLISNVGNDSVATHMGGEKQWLFKATGKYSSLYTNEVTKDVFADQWLSQNFYRIGKRHLLTTRINRLFDVFRYPKYGDLASRWTEFFL